MFFYSRFLFIFSIKALMVEVLAESKLKFRNTSYFNIAKLVYNS